MQIYREPEVGQCSLKLFQRKPGGDAPQRRPEVRPGCAQVRVSVHELPCDPISLCSGSHFHPKCVAALCRLNNFSYYGKKTPRLWAGPCAGGAHLHPVQAPEGFCRPGHIHDRSCTVFVQVQLAGFPGSVVSEDLSHAES